ncbi:hypothetical protein [Microbacterium sp. SL75]|uniref:hypothetical protein n=1 Tax=Microbacterium sp. SL75 TaxID=2995140 RepID=UPI00226F17BA|nr:hypothetical protein [Microbacterium sp. SL75]WAC69058.1 hypothetical protein OVA17_15990 [Microbacterium sp. SL75]
MPVHGGAAHPRRFADVAEGDAVEAAFGEEAGRGGEQGRAAIGLGAVARRARGGGGVAASARGVPAIAGGPSFALVIGIRSG